MLHQLRHTQARGILNDGVSLATMGTRVGHMNRPTPQPRFAEQCGTATDTAVWTRGRHR